jgi:hypothetical protein
MNNNSEEFARVIVSMGEFMDQGKTYEETYRHAEEITQSPDLCQLWKEMLTIANERSRSPLEAFKGREGLIGEWLLSIFFAGTVAGVETIWIKGGQTFLEVCRALRASPQASFDLQGRAFLKLVVAAIQLGVGLDQAVRGAQEIIENPELRNFMSDASHGLAAACRKYPSLFSSELVHTLERDESSSSDFSYDQIAQKLIL